MNKQEILNEINKTKEHLTNMEKMLEECEYKRWKPKDGEKYWYITNTNQLSQTDFTSERSYKREDDYQRWRTYNCFKTNEAAHAEAEKILIRRMLETISKKLNKGRKIDWESPEYKFHLIIFNDDVISQEVCRKIKYQGTVYCLDGNFKDVAIEKIGEERLKAYLRGE